MNRREVRAALQERVSVLSRRVSAIGEHLRHEDGRLGADFEDQVSFTEADQVLEALDDVGRRELEGLRAAIARIDDGSYGVCIACGEDIAERRLAAQPTALRCVPCEAAAERA